MDPREKRSKESEQKVTSGDILEVHPQWGVGVAEYDGKPVMSVSIEGVQMAFNEPAAANFVSAVLAVFGNVSPVGVQRLIRLMLLASDEVSRGDKTPS